MPPPALPAALHSPLVRWGWQGPRATPGLGASPFWAVPPLGLGVLLWGCAYLSTEVLLSVVCPFSRGCVCGGGGYWLARTDLKLACTDLEPAQNQGLAVPAFSLCASTLPLE